MKRLIIALMVLTTALQIDAANILSLDDLSSSKTYYIHATKGGYLYAYNNMAKYDGLSSPTNDDAHLWAITKSSTTGQVFIYNIEAAAFLSAKNGSCPLQTAPVMVQLLSTGQEGSWIGFAEGQVIALNDPSASSQILFLGDNGKTPDFLSFEEAGSLSPEAEVEITAKAKAYDTNRTEVPAISSIGTAITSLDQLTDGLTFLFYSTGMTKYAYDGGEALTFDANRPALNDITKMPYVFVAHKIGDAWKFSTMEGKYISGFSGGVSTGKNGITFTVTPSETSGSFNFYNANSSQYLNATAAKPVGWGSSEGNSRYQIIPVTLTNYADQYYPVTYLCYESDGENMRLMDTQTYAKTNNRLSPPAFTGYKRTSLTQGNGERFASTVMTGPAVAVCTYTRQLRDVPVIPTTIANGEFADTTHWYRIRVDGKYMQWTADAPGHYYIFNTERPTMDDSDLWCFVGNNITGYRIYNRAAGAALPLAFETEPVNSDLPFICDGPYNGWSISNGGTSSTWYLSPVGTDIPVYLTNDGQGKLSVYKGGSNINIDEAVSEMQAFAEVAAANLGNRLGQYDGAEANELVAASENYTLSNTAFNTLQQAYNNFVLNASRVELRENMLYRIININTTDATLKSDIDATIVSQDVRNESARTQLWQVLPIGNTDTYYLLNPENGRFMGQTKSSTTTTLVENPTTHCYGITNVPNTIAQWRLNDTGTSSSNYVSINSNNGVVGTIAGAEGAKWYIEPVNTFTVETVSSDGSAATTTLFLPFSVELPDGISAMAVTAKDDGGVEFTPFESNVVPANTPCVLISSAGGSYTLTETTAQGSAPEGNLLTGVAVRSSNEGDGLYTLDANANLIAAPAILPAYSAVLAYDNTTSINALGTNKAGESIWYDLSGRRLHKAPTTNGVYIQNGKKVLVR